MFWLVCLIPLVPQEYRVRASVAIFFIAFFASVMRIGFGAHYLSDVVLGALSTLVLYAMLAAFVSRHARRKSAVR